MKWRLHDSKWPWSCGWWWRQDDNSGSLILEPEPEATVHSAVFLCTWTCAPVSMWWLFFKSLYLVNVHFRRISRAQNVIARRQLLDQCSLEQDWCFRPPWDHSHNVGEADHVAFLSHILQVSNDQFTVNQSHYVNCYSLICLPNSGLHLKVIFGALNYLGPPRPYAFRGPPTSPSVMFIAIYGSYFSNGLCLPW